MGWGAHVVEYIPTTLPPARAAEFEDAYQVHHVTLRQPGQMARRVTRRAICSSLAVLLAALATAAPAGADAPSDLTPLQAQAQQWWIGRLGLEDVWKESQGAGTTVAVIDTGVNASFGDLQGAVLPGFGVGTGGDGRRDTDPAVHGTRMADDIAGRGSGFGLLGVARQAKILPVAAPELSDVATTEALTRLTALADPPVDRHGGWG